MAKTWASLFSLLIILSLASLGVQAQDNERSVILSDANQTHGPVWISVACVEVSCSGMELIITYGSSEYRHQDSHLVQWAGFIQGNFSWQVIADEGVNSEDLRIDMISSHMDNWTERDDLPDTVPPPGSQGAYSSINTSSPCQGTLPSTRITYCSTTYHLEDMLSDGVLFVGALSDQSDKDAMMIVGNPGDVMLLEQNRGANSTSIEIWHRTDDSKTLIGSKGGGLLPWYFEYPSEGELWLRVVHNSESGYSPYEFEIIRYDHNTEAPGGGELSNPWSHGEPLQFQDGSSLLYRGHIAASDSQGDSLLIASGPNILLQPQCTFRNPDGWGIDDVEFSITIHQVDDTELHIRDVCESFETTSLTISVEFRITTEGIDGAWAITLKSLSPSDGSLIGDAPDTIWDFGNMDSRWQVLNLEASIISGTLGYLDNGLDNTDYYAFSITEENGSYVRIQRIGDSIGSFTLMTLDQETGEVVNSTNGSMMIVPPGIHALKVQWEEGMSEGWREYQFSLPYNGPYVPQEEEFVDLSHRAQPFYIFAGFLLLTPLVMVIWWNRDAIFRGAPLAADIQEHERRRLRSLRQRLSAALMSEDIDQVEIEHSLKQLRESPWKAVVEDWGEPVIRHLTEKVEICVWRVSDSKSDLLIGIRVEEFPWDLAAIGVHAAEGSAIEIKSVSPSRLYQDGEVFLDTLSAGSKIFVGIELDGSSTTIGFHLSGLVDGAPLAAIPNKSLDW